MILPFTHPSSTQLLERVKNIFRTKNIRQRKDRHIIFLCGGPIKPRARSVRNRFLKYSDIALPQFRIFLAEHASKDLSRHNQPEFVNLADFESFATEFADCVIVFPESAGSIAELGYFTHNKKIIRKLLVVNDSNKQNDSFINIGLIDKINHKSDFRQTILIDYKDPEFLTIKQRLLDRLPTQQSSKFVYKQFDKLKSYQELFVVFQIVYLFRALKFNNIVYCISEIFGNAREKKIRFLLSILISAKYIERAGDDLDYFIPASNVTPFLEFRSYDINNLIAEILLFYQKVHLESYNIARGASS